MYIKRTLEQFIHKATKQFPVLLITGPRQVGKTTFLRHLSKKERTYVTLDDPVVATLAKKEPKLFLERFAPPILIDEIQYAPELFPYIKMHVDKTKRNGDFWLTGSQQFQLMKGVSETLAGRIGIINLLGLSQNEINKKLNVKPFLPDNLKTKTLTKPLSLKKLFFNIWRGSYPAIALNKNVDRDLFYSSYIKTYLQRDVRDLTKVGDETTFFRFLKACAARTGQLLNLADLARDADISPNTAKSWLSILQASGIIYQLEPYHTNITKRLVKAQKLYFIDTGLCAYLAEWSDSKTLETGAMSGAILETFVVTEILKSYWHNGKSAPLYYYRDKDTKEIDLIIVSGQTIYPIEIKKTSSPNTDHIKNFHTLKKLNKKIGHGAVICLTDTFMPINKTASAIPVSFL